MRHLFPTVAVLAWVAPAALAQDFTGSWDTPYKVMKLEQVEEKVTGTYNFGGPVTLTGTVRGKTLSFTTANKRGPLGKGTMVLSDDGESFTAELETAAQTIRFTGRRPPRRIVYPEVGSAQINRSGVYAVGDFVEIWHNGDGPFRWTVSRILEVTGDRYKVHYGGSQYNVLTVEETRIHNAAREKARGENLARWAELKVAIQSYRETLASFAHEHDPKRWSGQGQAIPDSPGALKKALDDMTAVEALMTGKFAGMTPVVEGFDDAILEHPEAWGEIARSRKSLAQKLARKAVAQKLAFEARLLREIAVQLPQQDGFGLQPVGLELALGRREAVKAKRFAFLKPLLDVVGLSLSEVSLADWDEAAVALVATARRVAQTARPSATYANAGFEAQVRAVWNKSYPDRKIVSVRFSRPGWNVTTNALGTPLYRHYGGMVRYRVSGFDLAIEQGFQRREDYRGAGKYVYRAAPYEPELRLVKQ